MHWRVERLIQGAMENLGYRTQVLPVATKEDLLTGRELADIGQCCPTSFTTGNLANFLRSKARESSPADVAQKYVYVTAGSCGACRFGQYHQSYELALRNIGLEAFRIFLVQQNQMDQGALKGGGLSIDIPLTLGVVWAILCTDALQSLEYRTRPYEVERGRTDSVVQESVALLCEAFRETGNPLYGARIEETAGWLLREMIAEGGGFAASLDADSEGEEGKFYVWTKAEIAEVLGEEDGAVFAAAYDVTDGGNWEGHNILNRLSNPVLGLPAAEKALRGMRTKLLARRTTRTRPGWDDKVLADWNGLMIAALAHAAKLMDRPEWLTAADLAFQFVLQAMEKGGRLAHA